MAAEQSWWIELGKVKDEIEQKEEEHAEWRHTIAEMSDILDTFDTEELKEKLQLLAQLEKEEMSSDTPQRISTCEDRIDGLQKRCEVLKRDLEDIQPAAIKKTVYDELQKMRKDMEQMEQEVSHKIEATTEKMDDTLSTAKQEVKEAVKSDVLENYSILENQISETEKQCNALQSRIANLKKEFDHTVADLFERNKADVHELTETVEDIKQQMESTGDSNEELEKLKQRLDHIVSVHNQIEERVGAIEEQKTSDPSAWKEQLRQWFEEFREEERQELERLEKEEVQLLDDKLQELHEKINRITAFVKEQKEPVSQLQERLESLQQSHASLKEQVSSLEEHVPEETGDVNQEQLQEWFKRFEQKQRELVDTKLSHMEDKIAQVENSMASSDPSAWKEQLRQWFEEFREEERQELDQFEQQEQRSVEERLQELENKLQRMSDYMIEHGKQLHETTHYVENELNDLRSHIAQYHRIRPTVVE